MTPRRSRSPRAPDGVDTLEATLRRRFRVVESTITIGGHELSMLHPASAEELIDEQEFALDERLPYWADLWPSSRVLGERVLEMEPRGRRLLELGCGAGLVAACAARVGFAVTATDYYDDALRFARVNAWRNAATDIATRSLDWRHLPADIGRYDVIVASDVLYERPYAALVAEVISRALAPAGTAIIADPGRLALGEFLSEARSRGLDTPEPERVKFAEGAVRQVIQVFELSWR